MKRFGAISILALVAGVSMCEAFTTLPAASQSTSPFRQLQQQQQQPNNHSKPTSTASSHARINKTILQMGLDMVTYLRCEWVSAALCTNQTPRAANVCLQLGTEDGRPITFIPRTIETFITSTVEPDGILPISVQRQLTQQEKNRGAATVSIVNQRADDLKETADESVDVVISLQAAARMKEKGLDWKKSIQEAARVLKPGGRFLFVEQSELDGTNYLEYVGNLGTPYAEEDAAAVDDANDEEQVDDEDDNDEAFPIFECIGYDDVDLVLVPHVAAVFAKSQDAGLTAAERAAKESKLEEERLAEVSITAFERGLKKRKRKKKKKAATDTE